MRIPSSKFAKLLSLLLTAMILSAAVSFTAFTVNEGRAVFPRSKTWLTPFPVFEPEVVVSSDGTVVFDGVRPRPSSMAANASLWFLVALGISETSKMARKRRSLDAYRSTSRK